MPKPLHFVCPGDAEVAEIESCLGGGAGWQRATARRVLLDTADRRLRGEGLYLVCDEQTGGCALTLHDRVGRPGASMAAAACPRQAERVGDSRLRKALLPVVAPRALLPVRVWETAVSRRTCRDNAGKIIGEIAVEHHRYDGRQTLTTVSAQPKRGYRPELRAHLAAFPAVARFAALREAPNALLDGRVAPSWDQSPPPPCIGLDTGTRAAFAALMEYYRRIMRDNERGIVEDVDTEFLHDFRVAMRRARTLLGAFRRVTGADRDLGADFTWLSRSTSLLRDLDVWLAALPRSPDGDDGQHLRGHLARRRAHEQARVARLLRGERYARFQDRLGRWLATVGASTEPAPSLSVAVDRAMRRRHARLRRRLRGHGDSVDPAVLHEVRKDAKKLRYLVDAFCSLYPRREAKALLAELKKLQTRAGKICDRRARAAILAEWLRTARGARLKAVLERELEHYAEASTVDLAAPEARKLARSLARVEGEQGARRMDALCRRR